MLFFRAMQHCRFPVGETLSFYLLYVNVRSVHNFHIYCPAYSLLKDIKDIPNNQSNAYTYEWFIVFQ
jgi:hypothetical protein